MKDMRPTNKGHAVKVTPTMREAMARWVKETGFTKERGATEDFRGNDWIAPGVGGHHGGEGVYLCPMCDYATTATNVCRECPEMPAEEEFAPPFDLPRPCHYRHPPHIGPDGKRRGHGYIMMVKVS